MPEESNKKGAVETANPMHEAAAEYDKRSSTPETIHELAGENVAPWEIFEAVNEGLEDVKVAEPETATIESFLIRCVVGDSGTLTLPEGLVVEDLVDVRRMTPETIEVLAWVR